MVRGLRRNASWGPRRLLPLLVTAVVTALAAQAHATAATASGSPTRAAGDDVLLLLVDYSGSMLRDDGTGSTRIAAAERSIREIVAALPDGLDVGMRVYGHRVPSADKAAACQDSELVVPIAPLDRDRLLGTVDALEPVGETPIGLTLQQVADDLPEDRPATVILVSDGADECVTDGLGPDPCEVTRDLVEAGVDLRLETIGLQVEPAGAEQLRCMAEAGGGTFTSVEDTGLLADALAAAQNRSLRTFQVRGEPVQGGPSLIDATVLPPGTYSDSILEGETLWYAVDLAADEEVTARLTVRTAEVPSEAGIALEWRDAAADRVDVAVLDGIARGQATTLAVRTGPADGSRSRFGVAREPGRYHLAVRVAGFPEDTDHEFVLELLGEASGEPPADAAPATAAAAPSTAGDETAPEPAPSAAAAVQPLPPPPGGGSGVALLALVVVLLAAGGGVWWWRRRREDGAPPDARASGYV